MTNSRTVYIVDADVAARDEHARVLADHQFQPQCFADGETFLDACDAQDDGCLILESRLPRMSGLQLQSEVTVRGLCLPVIFVAAHADLPTAVEATRRGAIDFLSKPVDPGQLVLQVHHALAQQPGLRQRRDAARAFGSRLAKITARERQVLALALSGMGNKEISARLAISLRTIEGHRSRILLKTGVASLLELVRLAIEAGVSLNVPPNGAETMDE